MPEDLAEGLYVAGVGMGLVFVTLLGFMLIMLALQRLFPGEVPPPEGQDAQRGTSNPGQKPHEEIEQAPAGLSGSSPPAGSQGQGGVPGPQIAAMAVAAYLSMEQEEQPATARQVAPTSPVSQQRSAWGTQARMSFMESQSRRPLPYGQKPRSAYPPGKE